MKRLKGKTVKTFIKAGAVLILAYVYILLALSTGKIRVDVAMTPCVEGEYSARLYYAKEKKWSKEDSLEVPLGGEVVTFELPISVFSGNSHYRLDPVSTEVSVVLQSVRVSYGSRILCQWSAEELYDRLAKVKNAEVSLQEDGLLIKPANKDPQLWVIEDAGLHFYGKQALGALGWLIACAVAVLIFYKLGRFLYGLPLLNGCKKRFQHFMESGLDTIRNDKSVLKWLFFVYSRGLILVLFLNFLQGKAYWLFTGVASDSYGQTYPSFYNFARRIAEGMNVAGWDFLSGLGNTIGQISVGLNNWVLFWGEENIAFLMAISYIIKIVLAQIAFYHYLRVLGRSRTTSYIFSLGYAFCGHMILRGRWLYYPNEVLLVALLLLSFELFFVKKDMRWFPLAIVLFVRESGTYQTILYVVVFAGYALFRYFVERKFAWKEFRGYCGRLLACVLLVMPILMWNFSGLSGITGSQRFTDGMNKLEAADEDEGYSVLLEKEYIQSAYFRTIGLDIVGVETEDFTGADNVLEDPTFYCGILTLLCIPFALSGRKGKVKYWYLAAFGIVAAYFFINPLRTVINGMVEPYHFKISSFWIVVLMLYLGSEGLDRLGTGYRNAKVAVATLIGIIAFGWAMIKWVNPDVRIDAFGVSCAFMVIYTVLLLFFQREGIGEYQRLTVKGLMVAVCVVEIFVMTYNYINPSKGIVNDLEARTWLNDYTLEALAYLDEYEDNDYYRIDKQYISYGYNDSVYQGYKGTKSYIGGTGVRGEVWDLYESLGMPKKEYSKIFGTSSSDPVNTLSSVKYILTKGAGLNNYGYEQIGKTKGIYIYENQYALPFVYGYTKYIDREAFEKLSYAEKQDTMLEYCVLEEQTADTDLTEYDGSLESIVDLTQQYETEWKRQGDGRVRIRLNNRDKEVVIVAVDANNKTGKTVISEIGYENLKEETGTMQIAIPQGENTLYFAFNGERFRYFWLNRLEKEKELKVIISAVYTVPQTIYYSHYRNSVESLKDISLENFAIDYKTSTVSGEITLDTPTQICFSIPYDRSWQLTVDGEAVEVEKMNIAFMGAYLPEGSHSFTLQYVVPNQEIQEIVTKIGYWLILIFFLVNSGMRIVSRRKRGSQC